jgi:hypothetical protein
LKPSNRFYVQGTETAAHGIDTEGIKWSIALKFVFWSKENSGTGNRYWRGKVKRNTDDIRLYSSRGQDCNWRGTREPGGPNCSALRIRN